MSSAILYVAIVVIWIGVLVPRWLRHDHARDGHLRLRRFSRRRDADQTAGDADARAGFSQDGQPRYTSFGGHGDAGAGASETGRIRDDAPPRRNPVSQNYNSAYVSGAGDGNTGDMAQLYETPEASAPARPPTHHEGPHHGDGPRHTGGSDSDREHGERLPHDGARRPDKYPDEYPGAADRERRARVVQGRRRMLWMLLALTAIGVGLAYLQLAAWWISIPPLVLLGGYLLLLREAAHADAEAREFLAAQGRRAREAKAQRTAEAGSGQTTGTSVPTGLVWSSPETDPRAEIIDISERVGDQLYDQYADAKLRAVGD